MIKIDEQVLADIGKGFSVPAKPELLLKLQTMMTEPEPDIAEIATVISNDIAIAATILKTINSPIYGLGRSIADIKRSVNYIGLNGIYSLVMGCLLKQSFGQQDCCITLDEFWQDATNIANTAVFVGKKLKQKIPAETLFTIGLFHDCGIVMMALKYDSYHSILTLSQQTAGENLIDLEEEFYQINHATLGYYVASSWRLPKDICQIILRHHDRDFLLHLDHSKQQIAFAILKMAENIIHQNNYGHISSDWLYLEEAIFELLDISEEDYQDLLEDLAEQLI